MEDPEILISAVVLAAGRSERMRPSKQLLEIEGRTMVRRVVSSTLDSQVDETIVVLGYKADQVAREIPEEDVGIVMNSDFEEGMSTSLKAGLEGVGEDRDAVVVVLADQPLLEPWLIDRLIEEYERNRCVNRGPRL